MSDPVRAQDLAVGQLGMIVEPGKYFGLHVLMVSVDDTGPWLVCVKEARIITNWKRWNGLVRLINPPDTVTLAGRGDIQGAAEMTLPDIDVRCPKCGYSPVEIAKDLNERKRNV